MATRTFLALDLDDVALDELAAVQEVLAAAGASVRWTGRENLHVTLKFLGDVDDSDLAGVCAVAAELAGTVEAFEFTLGRIVSVPPAGHMRMIWTEIGDPTGRMTALAEQYNDACAAMGYKNENRGFRPQLTLGRVKGGRNVAALRAAIAGLPAFDLDAQFADEVVVYASELSREGPIYTVLSRTPLG
ncbi:MAG: RNA 2',3'-cyclic phosphodiesterase [Planctomycetes bacterium]|nr:RNA 2',3'-cyclic phosphodiesterase [Planctomycetota bacterium]